MTVPPSAVWLSRAIRLSWRSSAFFDHCDRDHCQSRHHLGRFCRWNRGLIVGVYSFGVGLMLIIGRSVPSTIGMRALAAGVGSITVGVIALIPFPGGIFVILLTPLGVGAIILKTLEPALFVKS